MSKPKFKQQTFKEIQARWYAILKTSGFQDAEDSKHDLRPLITWHSLKWQKIDPERFKAKRDYFNQAERFLATYDFETDEHKIIWLLHSEGLSVREIEYEISISRNQVHKVIVMLREIMKDWGDD